MEKSQCRVQGSPLLRVPYRTLAAIVRSFQIRPHFNRTRVMKQLLRTVAVLIALLLPTFANTVPIKANGSEDYLDDCGNYNLTLYYPNSIILQKYSISLPLLKCLTIGGSGIRSAVNRAFDKMSNLWYLNLQRNNIPADNLFSFGDLPSARMLILSNQNWGHYTRATLIRSLYPHLRYLDLNNNGISGIRLLQKNPFPELRYLDLSTNELEIFNFIRSQAENLTHLYLNDNKISQFSLGPSALMWLALDNNNIKTIGEGSLDLGGLTNLKNLSLHNNQIEFIRDEAFRDTVSLQHLNISMNSLSTILPETFRNLQSLQVLILDQNFLEEVPIAVPLNITTLSMNCNRVKYLTNNSLFNLPQLKTLSLAGNRIMNVHQDAFQNQEMLEELYLNNNELSYLPNEWCRTMKNLLYLDLSGNAFTMFESIIHSSFPSLRQIHLEHNPLKFINASTFETLPKYVNVYLENTRRYSVESHCREVSGS